MPLRLGDFFTGMRQASAWIEEYEPSVREVLRLALGPWSNLFSGEPTVLPADLELPVEVPRIVLASADRAWIAQIARRRINVRWERGANDVSSNEFSRVVLELLEPFLGLSRDVRTSRLAYVTSRFCPHDDPGHELSRYFCRDGMLARPLNRPKNFELHAHKVYQPGQLPRLNSWMRWKTGTLPGSRQSAVVLEQDLNTLAEDMPTSNYGLADVHRFFERITDEADDIVQVYLDPRHA